MRIAITILALGLQGGRAGAPAAPARRAGDEAVRKALAALDELASDAVSYGDYRTRLARANALIDEALPQIRGAELRAEICLAIHDYQYAALAWQLMIDSPHIPAESHFARALRDAYPAIRPKREARDGDAVVYRRDVLDAVWSSASAHHERARRHSRAGDPDALARVRGARAPGPG